MKQEEWVNILNTLIKERRSTFPMEFNGEMIEHAIIEQIIENANWAPNHGRTEPWRFKVFTAESLKQLADFQAAHYKKSTPLEAFSQLKYDRFIEKAQRTSHVIAICMKRDSKNRIPENEEIAAVSCAVQNIYLSMTAYGLRGYWGSGGGTYTKEIHQYLGLAEDERCLGFFYLGMSDKALREGNRRSVNEKTKWM